MAKKKPRASSEPESIQAFLNASYSLHLLFDELTNLIENNRLLFEAGGQPSRESSSADLNWLSELRPQLPAIGNELHRWRSRIISSDPGGSHATTELAGMFGATAHDCAWLALDNAASTIPSLRRETGTKLESWGDDTLAECFKRLVEDADFRMSMRISSRLERERAYLSGRLSQNGDDNAENAEKKLPESENVLELCRHLQKSLANFGSEIACARDFCKKHQLPEKKARNLMRQAYRHPHIWRR